MIGNRADLAALHRLRTLRERQATQALAEQRRQSAQLDRQREDAEQACQRFEQRFESQRDADWQVQLGQPLSYVELQALQDREASGRSQLQALCRLRDETGAAHQASEQACAELQAALAQRQRQVQALAEFSARQLQIDLRRAEVLADLNSEDIPYHAAHR